MSTVYFTSDLHLRHDFVAKTRGWADSEAHDEALKVRWNERVGKRDTVWVLGDLGMGHLTPLLEDIAQLNGAKHLVLGNHDTAHPLHRGAYSKQRRYLDVFESVQIAAQLRIEGERVMLSHFPYSGDHKDADRYVEWRLRDEGLPLLCGHVHSAWKYNAHQLNVGVDFSSNLVSLSEVTQWLKTFDQTTLNYPAPTWADKFLMGEN